MDRELFVVIDGNSLMHRAFHAIPPLTNKDGVFTNAVYGFLNMMLKIIEDERPSYLAVAFDLKGPTFRHSEYSDYKAGRKPTAPELSPQFSLISECLSQMNIRILTCPAFEADDILGTMARRCEESGLSALLVTGDRDALQLVSENTSVLYTKRGVSQVIRYTPDSVKQDFGVTPEQIPDLKGLMGDSSDNIPGIPGIGEKSAVRLLSQFSSLEEVLNHAATDIKGSVRLKLLDGASLGLLSKKLATINRQAPLNEVSISDCRLPDFAEDIPILHELGMNSIITHIQKLRKTSDPDVIPENVCQAEGRILSNPEEVAEWLREKSGQRIAFLPARDVFFLACDDRSQVSLPISRGFLKSGFEPEEAYVSLKPLFAGTDKLILYDSKAVMTALWDLDVRLTAEFDDVHIIHYLLFPNENHKKCPDNASALLSLFNEDYPKLDHAGMLSLYREIELPLVSTLFSMEREGFLIDRSELMLLGKQFSEQLTSLKQEIFALCETEPFNLNSTQQLGEVLFNKLGLPAGKKNSRGYSTDAETLQKLSGKHPVIDRILSYRQIAKLNSTYIDSLIQLADVSNRIHTLFDQTAAATGRISSSEPNLQNIPVRTEIGREIRRAFVADGGCILVDADYSQIELRILAHLSADEAMCDAFLRNQDIHQRTAAEVFGVPLDRVTPEMRSRAKAVNFGIVYGISDFGLASNLHISRREASEFIEKYFERYPSVRQFMEQSVESAKENGYSVTLFGRRRPIPELSSGNYNVRQLGERISMNTPVQGTAADIIKIAMNNVYRHLTEEGLRARLVLQIHDELIVETPADEKDRVCEILRDCMESAASLRIPLVADIHTGHSWYETK